MLVQVIMEFIAKAKSIKSLDQRDSLIIDNISNYFSQFDSNQIISSEQIDKLKTIISDRFNQIIDTVDDLTFRQNCKINTLFINLLQQVSHEYNISLVTLLFPKVDHAYDLVTLRRIRLNKPMQDLCWIILSEDNRYLIDIRSLIERVLSTKISYRDDCLFFKTDDRKFSPYIALNSPVLRAFSVRELLRIRHKSSNETINYALNKQTTREDTIYSNIWDYFVQRIMPQWHRKGKLLMHLVRPLLQLVDSFDLDKSIGKSVFKEQLLLWSKILLGYPVDDVNHLYTQPISIGEGKKYFINVVLDCLEKEPNKLNFHIQGLAEFLITCNASYISKQKDESKQDDFLIGSLKTLKRQLKLLKLKSPASLEQSIDSLLEFVNDKVQIDVFVLEKLEQFYSQHHQEINASATSSDRWIRLAQRLDSILIKLNYYAILRPIPKLSFKTLNQKRLRHGSVYYSLFDRTYEHFSGFLTQYAAPTEWIKKFDEIPRHVLPLLFDLMDVYFEQPIDSFRTQLNAWLHDLQDQSICAVNDVHYLFRQLIQYNNKTIYFLDAVLILLYDKKIKNTDHAIFALATWLCEYDESYIAKHEKFRIIYQKAQLGPYFDRQRLKQMVTDLQAEVISPVDQSQLNSLIQLIDEKTSIDQTIIDAIEVFYKNRDLLTLTPRWKAIVAALNGAQMIPSNYYVWLGMNVFDSVKFVPTIDYPFNHYVASENGFILLDNSAAYYNKQLQDESCIESFRLYNCNSESLKPLTGDERCQILRANKKFHKYFYLTNTPQCVDEPICTETLNALVKLVNHSVYAIGTLYTGAYNKDQQKRAENAYAEFTKFYNEMDHDERVRLNNQIISFEGKHKSFKKLLLEINDYQCIAKAGQFILQLVVDYDPFRSFNNNIERVETVRLLGGWTEASVGIERMRMNSKHKTPRDLMITQQQLCTV